MYYVYVLESCKNNQWYIGQSSNLKLRLKEHNDGKSIHTKRNLPWKLIFYVSFIEKSDSIRFEKYLKSGYGRKFLKNCIRDYIGVGI